MEYEIYNSSDELAHWGVVGMKWGVRRYQNKDGSLTAAGRRRIKAETDKLRAEEQVLKNRRATKAKFDRLAARRKSVEEQKKELDDADSAANAKKSRRAAKSEKKQTKKSIKDMTDEELANAINRSRLEDQYRQLNPEKKTMMKTLADDIIKPAATNAGRQFLQNALTKMGEKMLQGKVDPNSIEALKKTYEKLDLQKKIEKLKSGKEDLSIEDLNKKTRLQWDTEDRKAKSEGYDNWADKVNKSRKANEARSYAEYEKTRDTTYSGVSKSAKKAEEKVRRTALLLPGSSDSSTSRNLPAVIQNKSVSNLSKTTTSHGETVVNNYRNLPLLPSSSSANNKVTTIDLDDDGNVVGYWSDIRGDSDGIMQ